MINDKRWLRITKELRRNWQLTSTQTSAMVGKWFRLWTQISAIKESSTKQIHYITFLMVNFTSTSTSAANWALMWPSNTKLLFNEFQVELNETENKCNMKCNANLTNKCDKCDAFGLMMFLMKFIYDSLIKIIDFLVYLNHNHNQF